MKVVYAFFVIFETLMLQSECQFRQPNWNQWRPGPGSPYFGQGAGSIGGGQLGPQFPPNQFGGPVSRGQFIQPQIYGGPGQPWYPGQNQFINPQQPQYPNQVGERDNGGYQSSVGESSLQQVGQSSITNGRPGQLQLTPQAQYPSGQPFFQQPPTSQFPNQYGNGGQGGFQSPGGFGPNGNFGQPPLTSQGQFPSYQPSFQPGNVGIPQQQNPGGQGSEQQPDGQVARQQQPGGQGSGQQPGGQFGGWQGPTGFSS